MSRACFFFDGFNFYHSIDKPNLHRFKWLSYARLATNLKFRGDDIRRVVLFTAYANWDQHKVDRHRILLNAQREEGVEVIFGRFKLKDCKCKSCGSFYTQHIEKQTDVNIAVNLLKSAMKDEFDRAYLVSGDTDLIPAIKVFREMFPAKEICVVFPFRRKGEELKTVSHFHRKIQESQLIASLLPDPFVLKDGPVLNCPPSWK